MLATVDCVLPSFFATSCQNRRHLLHLQLAAGQQAALSCNQLIVSVLGWQDGNRLEQTILCDAGGKLVNLFVIEHLSWLIGIGLDFILRD